MVLTLQKDGGTAHTAEMVQAWCQRTSLLSGWCTCDPILHLALIQWTLWYGPNRSRKLAKYFIKVWKLGWKIIRIIDVVDSETVRATCAQVIQRIRRINREKCGYIELAVMHVDDYTFFCDSHQFYYSCCFCFRKKKRKFSSLHLGGGPCVLLICFVTNFMVNLEQQSLVWNPKNNDYFFFKDQGEWLLSQAQLTDDTAHVVSQMMSLNT